MEVSERKHQSVVYSSTISQFIQIIMSDLLREISAYYEITGCSSETVPFLLRSFQIRWIDLTPHRAYSELSINDSELLILSLINNTISQIIDQHSVPTSVTNL
jgi:hypothetical protein